ncbi:MarR family winged helix-turn-helix transcriptional regulator [Micromonospora sp. LH3U1]|uniref:MarR family winged helix-turn-helix transcriptional regulator n=1 Tax=Micromonospora sp. LH3U1 TaxID=3018339 RepID=UPI00234B0ACD|nr:MarR family winged helix-turn-helix transcriptional regulator [Micromonospora sp. LH3U1]WCN78650.1 MarR family winged helix-turn-helix transcriptional regulator [Micromonospora sp. LH3U1]
MDHAAPQSPAGLSTTPSWLLNQTASHAARLLSEGFAAHDLRGYHYRLLASLAEDGPASQADLGRRCGIDRSDVVAAVNDLAGRGLVVRAPDPADRRRNIISSTDAGTAEARRMGDTVDRVQRDLLAPLSNTERAQLTRLLTRLLEHHSRH